MTVDKSKTSKLASQEFELIRQLFDSSELAVLVSSPDNNSIIYANQASTRLLVRSLDQLYNTPDIRSRIIATDHCDRIINLNQEFGASRSTYIERYRIQLPNGDSLPIVDQTKFISMANGETQFLVSTYTIDNNELNETSSAQAQLESSLSLLNATLESTADGILVVDQSGKIRSFNQRFIEMWLIPQEILDSHDDSQALAFVLDQLVDPHDFLKKVHELYSLPYEESFDLLLFKDGRTFERYSRPQMLGSKVVGRVWSFRDVTERTIAENRLRENEAKLRLMFENNQAAIVVIDPRTRRIVEANPSACKFYGYHSSQLKDMDFGEIFATPGAEIDKRLNDALWERQNNFRSMHRIATGEVREVEVHATPISFGNNTYIYSIIHDITDRVRAEKALKESEERFRLVAQVTNDALYDWNVAEDTLWASDGLQRMLGEEIWRNDSRQNWLELIHPDDRNRTEIGLQRTISGDQQIWRAEYRARRRDGSYAYLIDRGFVVRNQKGLATRIVGALIDITERKEAESSLRQSEAKYRSLFENMLDAFAYHKVVCDETGNPIDYVFLEANSAFEKFTGLKRENIIGKRVTEVIPNIEKSRGNWINTYAHVALSGEEMRFEQYSEDLGRWYSVMTYSPRYEYFVTIFEDISERKMYEEALLESERFLHSALDSLSAHIAILDESGRILAANEAWLKFGKANGASLQDIGVGSNYLEVCESSTDRTTCAASEVAMGIRKVIAGELPSYKCEYPCHSPNEERWFLLNVTRFLGLGPIRVVVSHENITALKVTEKSLAKLAAAVEQATEAIIITDLNGTIEYVNPAFERISGYDRNEAIGQNTRILRSGTHDNEFYANLWHVLNSGQSWVGRFKNRRKDGNTYEEEAAISPIRDQNGNISNYVAVKRDITQEVELEGRLRHAQKMEAVGQLASGIAHDFNNLLAGIRGFAELLCEEAPKDSKMISYSEEIVTAANRAADLTGQLLAFARKGNYLSVPVNLHDSINEAAAMLSRAIDKRIELQYDLKALGSIIIGDPSQIQSAILNLGLNARDAMPDGGTLTFATRNVTLDDEYCRVHSLDKGAGAYIEISVQDSGVGIDEKILGNIFDPFFTTKEQGRGTGLGLAGVYGCAKNHHGSIRVESTLQQGSNFILTFPVLQSPVFPEKTIRNEGSANGKERILIIDDELTVRSITEKILSKAGYSAIMASDGQSGIKAFAEQHSSIDLVLLDMVMPKINGRDTYLELKKISPDVKVILMSGYSSEDIEGLLKLGIIAFIPKPFQIRQLLTLVRQTLDKHQIKSTDK